MKYALLMLDPPKQASPLEDAEINKWWSLVHSLTSTKTKTDGVEYIQTGIWTIPLQSDLPFLSKCIHLTIDAVFPYRVLFLEEKPEWIVSPPLAVNVKQTP